MRVRRLILALSAVTALTFALAAPAVATQGQHVPFQMHLVGADRPLNMSPGFPVVRDAFAGRCSVPSDWVTTIDLRGTAEHLGRVSVVASHCTQFDIFTTPNPGVFQDGEMVVKAANGDELWLEYAGHFLFTPGDTPEVGVSAISFTTVTVVGGTGRFEGATGSLTGHAIDNFPAGPHIASFSGWIVYDPSVQAH
jgi:hypothetical protein